jgi:purine-nucleoside phosphorylase
MIMEEKFALAYRYVKDQVSGKYEDSPVLALVLGSGLGNFAEKTDVIHEIPYGEIPGFPTSSVQGHAGKLVLASLKGGGNPFWIMQGRVHYYEGYSMEEVVFPVKVLIKLGIKKIVVTNAAGGVNRNFDAGDLMIIRDHINMMGTNPLIGPNMDSFGTRFPDMTNVYSRKLALLLQRAALDLSIHLKEGVYTAMTGPSFETPAEVRMIEKIGGDAVGMSTVPEVIVARHAGLEISGISFISNKAAGISSQPLTHEEVNENAVKVEDTFSRLMEKFLSIVLEDKDG